MLGTIVGLIGLVYGLINRDGYIILLSCILITIDNKEINITIHKG